MLRWEPGREFRNDSPTLRTRHVTHKLASTISRIRRDMQAIFQKNLRIKAFLQDYNRIGNWHWRFTYGCVFEQYVTLSLQVIHISFINHSFTNKPFVLSPQAIIRLGEHLSECDHLSDGIGCGIFLMGSDTMVTSSRSGFK